MTNMNNSEKGKAFLKQRNQAKQPMHPCINKVCKVLKSYRLYEKVENEQGISYAEISDNVIEWIAADLKDQFPEQIQVAQPAPLLATPSETYIKTHPNKPPEITITPIQTVPEQMTADENKWLINGLRDKPFFIDTFRKLLRQFDKQEISMSKVVEELNRTAYRWKQSQLYAQPPAAEVVAFANWLMENDFVKHDGMWSDYKGDGGPQYTDEQLYQLFLATTKPEGGNQ